MEIQLWLSNEFKSVEDIVWENLSKTLSTEHEEDRRVIEMINVILSDK